MVPYTSGGRDSLQASQALLVREGWAVRRRSTCGWWHPPGTVHETDEDLEATQRLLDASWARAGSHLKHIWGEETRLDARELSAELPGVQVLDLATVTPRGEPRVAPVDGFFFRGRFWFGSSPHSTRFRNIRR